jgi:hypothetical protein
MTAEETAQYYAARQRYREKCDDFKQELDKYLSNYERRI